MRMRSSAPVTLLADGRGSRWAQQIAGLALTLTVFLSLLLAAALPHYLKDRVLNSSEVVELLLPLTNPDPERFQNPSRQPRVYHFSVEGVEYRGTPFLSEEAILHDHASGKEWARVVYAKERPVFHRMEPVSEAGGVRWVGIFPYLLAFALALTGVAWLVASWEHLLRLVAGRRAMPDLAAARRRRVDWAMVVLNTLSAPVFIALPLSAMTALMAFMGSHDLYQGLGPLLTVGSVALVAWLLVAAVLGRRFRCRGEEGGVSQQPSA